MTQQQEVRMSVVETDRFYRDMPAFADFAKVTDERLYQPAPDDWVVAVADIRSSTQAVREGRYKDVNMVGACCITAALNIIDDCEIPYVFGGDGATLIMPSRHMKAVRRALLNTSHMSEEAFGLSLRIGFVPVRVIREQGQDVMIARFELSRGNALAMFSGGGVELADKLIKEDDGSGGFLAMRDGAPSAPDLTGLSCRWKPLKPRNGRMLCLLIRTIGGRGGNHLASYARVISGLTGILGQDPRGNSPVTEETLRFGWPPKGLAAEAHATRGRLSFSRRYLHLLAESAIQAVCNLFGWKAGAYDAAPYRRELQTNSDYRRFDDMLRFVLDCDPGQVAAIRALLEEMRNRGEIIYGTHEADEALMTCLVFSLEASEHVHFIDGGNGGFWAAAVEFKKQAAALNEES